MLQREVLSVERRTVKLTLTFIPIGIFRKIKCWLGLDFPGPILVDFCIDNYKMRSIDKRIRFKTKVVEEILAFLEPGKINVRIALNPEDFNRQWEMRIRLEQFYN